MICVILCFRFVLFFGGLSWFFYFLNNLDNEELYFVFYENFGNDNENL